MNLSCRNIVALVGVTASLALPIAAYAESTTGSASSVARQDQAGHPRIDFAAIAKELGLATATVRSAISAAHATNLRPEGRPTEAQRSAFEAAVASNLGVSKDAVSAAFAAVKAAHDAGRAS